MFAPNHHRLSPTLAKVRRGLGFPTIFNCVGPLCNPASAPHQLIGVWDNSMVEKVAGTLARLGTTRSWVVHGSDGLDEVALNGPTTVAEIFDGSVELFEISPEIFGAEQRPTAALCVETVEESAGMILDVLNGKETTAAATLVGLNASAAIYLASGETDLRQAFAKAMETIKTGDGGKKLDQLKEMMNR